MFRPGLLPAGSPTVRPAARLGMLGLAAALVLGGCTGSNGDPRAEAAEGTSSSATPISSADAEDDATESASASPIATPAPAAVYKPATAEGPAENVPLPIMPELAKQESKEGLEAFAEYWYSLINYGFETGDVSPLQQTSGSECVVCANVYDLIGHGYVNDDWIIGGNIDVLQTQSAYILTSRGVYQVLVIVRQDPYEYRGPQNRLYKGNGGMNSSTVQMIEATYTDGYWFAHDAVTIK